MFALNPTGVLEVSQPESLKADIVQSRPRESFVGTKRRCDPEEAKEEMLKFSQSVAVKKLPTAPKDFIVVHDDPTRPQPRIDREINDGMTTVVGRLRKDPVFSNGLKYVLLSHNEKMGSAKGAVLLAESLKDNKIL